MVCSVFVFFFCEEMLYYVYIYIYKLHDRLICWIKGKITAKPENQGQYRFHWDNKRINNLFTWCHQAGPIPIRDIIYD